MKRNGFTLVELLGVIVIISVIALITLPIINDILENVRMEAYRDTGYGILDSANIYITKNLETTDLNKTFEFPDNYEGLHFKGEVPKGGYLKVDGNKTELFIYNDKFCASKSLSEEKIKVEKLEDNNGTITGCGKTIE